MSVTFYISYLSQHVALAGIVRWKSPNITVNTWGVPISVAPVNSRQKPPCWAGVRALL